jgi:hypothetical protein
LAEYIYVLLMPAFAIGVGIATIVYGLTAKSEDWATRLPVSLFCIGLGLVPALYLLGMRVEVDRRHVSKIFLFGLTRESIPIGRLATTVDNEHDRSGFTVPAARFMNVGGRGAFSLYRTWVWRTTDVNRLLGLASLPWDPNASMKRQSTKLIAVLVLLGIIACIFLAIHFWGICANGGVSGC